MPSIFDFLEMLPEPAKGLLPVGIAEFVLEFFESEVDNVMVMDFLGRQVATQFQPNAMQKIDFLGGQAWRMWTQIEDVFLASWKVEFERQLRFGIR